MASGIFGEMMLTYFKGRGGIGVVIDGCIRDCPAVRELGLGLWLRGVTPNFHVQTSIFPFAVALADQESPVAKAVTVAVTYLSVNVIIGSYVEPKILVVGSANMDLVVRTPNMPSPGETVLGRGFVTCPGGKGANQAGAAPRLGARCRMIARVGDDAFGRQMLDGLQAEGIDCTDVTVTPGAPTGVAMIVVDSTGENSIVVASGANARLTPDDLFDRGAAFKEADVLVLQLELPLPTVRAAIDPISTRTVPARVCRRVTERSVQRTGSISRRAYIHR